MKNISILLTILFVLPACVVTKRKISGRLPSFAMRTQGRFSASRQITLQERKQSLKYKNSNGDDLKIEDGTQHGNMLNFVLLDGSLLERVNKQLSRISISASIGLNGVDIDRQIGLNYFILQAPQYSLYNGFTWSDYSLMNTTAFSYKISETRDSTHHIFTQFDFGRQNTLWYQTPEFREITQPEEPTVSINVKEFNSALRLGMLSTFDWGDIYGSFFIMMEIGYIFNHSTNVNIENQEPLNIQSFESDNGEWYALSAGFTF